MAQLLLVDDSEAILSFERAALSAHHAIATAVNGADALDQVARVRPEAIVLDLSMPVMGGDEVLRRLKADPALAEIPVLVVSSEVHREQEVLRLGAEAFIPKPLRADALVEAVERMLEGAAERVRAAGLAVLPLDVGGRSFAVPLSCVRRVLPQLPTRLLPGAPSYVGELIEVAEGAVPVLDLATRLGVEHRAELLERKLVIVVHRGAELALCVDEVHDPEQIPEESVIPAEKLAAQDGALRGIVVALVRAAQGVLPVLDPAAVVPGGLARSLPELVAALRSVEGTR